jgi:hypothetical protein
LVCMRESRMKVVARDTRAVHCVDIDR